MPFLVNYSAVLSFNRKTGEIIEILYSNAQGEKDGK